MSDYISGHSNNRGDNGNQQPGSRDQTAAIVKPVGLMVHKDVASRRTALVIETAERARQDITRSRKILFISCLLMGLLLIFGPYLASILAEYFFYDQGQIIWALRRVAHELWIVFAVPGLLLVACSIMGLAKKIPVVLFDMNSRTIQFKDQRFQALPGRSRPSSGEVIQLADVQELQIVSYKAKQLQYRNKPVDQFELNVLLHDGERRLVAKQPGYDSLLLDATRLARFLGVAVTDHSAQTNRLPA